MEQPANGHMEFLRQLDIVPPEALARLPVVVIGAGGIGSFTVLALAKMGVKKITVYDFDKIESHNLPNQWYRLKDVGRPKVEALAEIVKDYTGVEIVAKNEKYMDQPLSGIVVVGVDSMDVRQYIWDRVKLDSGIDLLIDGRMGGEQFYVYSIRPCDPDDIEWYEERMYPSSKAADVPCSARSIIYVLLSIAAEVSGIVKAVAVKKPFARELLRDFPTTVLQSSLNPL